MLCTVLYKGHGYSETFEDNMAEIVGRLAEGTKVTLKTSPDAICSECPNRLQDGGCALDENKKEKSDDIRTMDECVLDILKLSKEEIYDSKYIFERAKENITREFFEACCGECRWNKMGLCSFDEYMQEINRFT